MPRKKLVRAGFTFFPNDWVSDTGLMSCTLVAQGMWMHMLCLMFKSPKRGYLLMPNGEPVTPQILAVLARAPEGDVATHWAELKKASVFSQTCTGLVFCRRMLRDIKKLEKFRKDNERKRLKQNSNYEETKKKLPLLSYSDPIPIPNTNTSPLPPEGGSEEAILKKCHKCNFEGLSLAGHECRPARKSFSQPRSNRHEQTQRESPAERSSRQTREQAERVAAMLSAGSK